MPGFIRNKKDEAKWSKAKAATAKSKGKEEDSFTDQDWALTNHVYHNMEKADISYIDGLRQTLEKMRSALRDGELNKASDDDEGAVDPSWFHRDQESEDSDDYSPHGGSSLFDEPEDQEESDEDESQDLGQNEDDAASKWLREHGEESQDEEPISEDEGYGEQGAGEDEEPSYEEAAAAAAAADPKGSPAQRPQEKEEEVAPAAAEQPKRKSRKPLPEISMDDLAHMREYTKHLEDYENNRTKLHADPTKNPMLFSEGKQVAVRKLHHGSKVQAHASMQQSPEYQEAKKNGDRRKMVELDKKFAREWHEQNPEHLNTSAAALQNAKAEGEKAKPIYDAAQREHREDVLAGGMQPEKVYSRQEAIQHAGGQEDEEGGSTSSLGADPVSMWAKANSNFVRYAKKNTGASSQGGATQDYEHKEPSKQEVEKILGPHPSTKPELSGSKEKHNKLMGEYMSLIPMIATSVLRSRGMLQDGQNYKTGPQGELIEAMTLPGLKALVSAVNSYKDDKGAAFSTWASNKIRGEIMRSLDDLHPVSRKVRQEQKKFERQGGETQSAPAPTPTAPAAPTPAAPAAPAKAESASDFLARGGKVTKVPVSAGGQPAAPTPAAPASAAPAQPTSAAAPAQPAPSKAVTIIRNRDMMDRMKRIQSAKATQSKPSQGGGE